MIYGDRICVFSFGRYYQVCQPLDCMNTFFPIFHQSVWIRHSLAVSHPFDKSYKIGADYHQLYTLYKENFVFRYIPRALSVFDSEYGVSSSLSNRFRMYIEVSRVLNTKVPIKVYFVVALAWIKVPIQKLISKVYPAYFSAQKRGERLLKRSKSLRRLEEKKD